VRLLVTRPEPDGERTAKQLRARGFDVLLAPLLRVETIPDAAFGPGPWSALAITSANAARVLAQHARREELLPLPVFAVGQRSAEAARDAGFGKVSSADGNETNLIDSIAAHVSRNSPLLYLAGEDRAGDLAGALAARGIAVQTVTVYRASAVAAFTPDVQAALAGGEIDGVLHFSRRSAAAFVHCAEQAGIREPALAATHYCLSPQVAEPLAAAGAGSIAIAARPDEAALMALISPR
jgi:uroporphyrinogen-III synthase